MSNGEMPHGYWAAAREIERLTAERDRLAAALNNLYALVQGECPRLLDDDHHDEMVRGAIARTEGK